MKTLDSGITAAKGFQATGTATGLKRGMKKDIALIASDLPAQFAVQFSQGRWKSPAVLRNQELMKKGNLLNGIAIYSGGANLCHGLDGILWNQELADIFSQCMGVKDNTVFTAFLGPIQNAVPIEAIKESVQKSYPGMGSSRFDAKMAGDGILTTDFNRKEAAVSFEIAEKTVTIGAMAKGRGLPAYDMPSQLCVIASDVSISQELLRESLQITAKRTFDMVFTGDEDSPNDMLLLLSNGLAGNPLIQQKGEEYQLWLDALYLVCENLAKQIASDRGELGKRIAAVVHEAKTQEDAMQIARAVVHSRSVCAGVFAEECNWPAALCAISHSGAYYQPERISIAFETKNGSIVFLDQGRPRAVPAEKAAALLEGEEVKIHFFLDCGSAQAEAWCGELDCRYLLRPGEN